MKDSLLMNYVCNTLDTNFACKLLINYIKAKRGSKLYSFHLKIIMTSIALYNRTQDRFIFMHDNSKYIINNKQIIPTIYSNSLQYKLLHLLEMLTNIQKYSLKAISTLLPLSGFPIPVSPEGMSTSYYRNVYPTSESIMFASVTSLAQTNDKRRQSYSKDNQIENPLYFC